MKPLRTAVVGTGRIADKVTPRLQEAEGIEVVAAVSRDEGRAAAFATEHGLANAMTERAFLDDADIDAAYITVPNHMHPALSIRCVHAGKHALCEKPLAWRRIDAERVFAEASSAGLVVVEAFAYPHTRWIADIREQVGRLGTIKRIEGFFEVGLADGPTTNVRFSRALAGGAMMDLGCYPMGFARLIAGEPEMESIRAGCERVDLFDAQEAVDLPDDGVDGSSWARWTTGGGVEVEIACSMVRQGKWEATIQCEMGSVRVPRVSIPTGFTVTTPAGEEVFGDPTETGWDDGPAMYTLQAESFARAARGDEPVPSPAWTITQTEIMERVLRAMGLDLGTPPGIPES